MTVETATYISQLNPTLPSINDPKAEGDDHLRLTKSVLQNQFPNLGAAAVTVTAAELNSVPGKAAKAGDTYSGTHDMTGATVRVATQAATDASTKAASTEMVQNAILASSGITANLPGQGGNAGKVLKTNGVSPAWGFPALSLSSRTANAQLTAADSASFINVTSGTFTQTFDACASLGNGWWCYLRNSGTGDITLDPNGGELIDGMTSYIMYPGECRLIQCNGTTLTSIVLKAFYREFTASGTFTRPPGYSAFGFMLWGGGGSGGKTGFYAAGGGGGACVAANLPSSMFGSSEVITIGAGGAGTSGATGNNGGNSSIGSLVTSYGGAGGSSNAGGGGGGWLSAGLFNLPGSPETANGTPVGATLGGGAGGDSSKLTGFPSVYGGGGGAAPQDTNYGNNGGNSLFGGAGGGSAGQYSTGSGGTSKLGGNGGAGTISNTGIAGSAPGGGGGGTYSGATSGAGARGELRIWGIA